MSYERSSHYSNALELEFMYMVMAILLWLVAMVNLRLAQHLPDRMLDEARGLRDTLDRLAHPEVKQEPPAQGLAPTNIDDEDSWEDDVDLEPGEGGQ